MSSDINRVNVTGHLTSDAAKKVLPTGITVIEFGIKVYDHRKQDGEWKDVPGFYDCQYFGKRAESLEMHGHLLEGQAVAIEGKLRWSSWEQDGQKRSKVRIVVDDLAIPRSWQDKEPKPKAEVETSTNTFDEDIPF